MSNTLSSKNFGLKLYNRFPHKYREDDVDQNYALKRYLESLAEGGFEPVIEDINGILSLVDSNAVKSNLLPILFKQYGLEVFNGIPEEYLRYLLPNISEAWSKKGSISVIEYITSSLTGLQTSSSVSYDEKNDPTIAVRLEMDSGLSDYVPNTSQFKRLLENFVPFYCDIVLVYTYLFLEDRKLIPLEDDKLKIVDTKIDLVKFKALIEEGKQKIRSKLKEESKIDCEEQDYLKYILKSLLDNIRVRFSELAGKEKITFKSTDLISFKGVEPIISQHINIKPLTEEIDLKGLESLKYKMKTKPTHDSPKVRFSESDSISYATLCSDKVGFRLRQEIEEPELNSTFGYATLGNALFGYGQDTSDTIDDFIQFLYSEVDDIEVKCNITHYDIIIVDGERQVIYS